MVKYLFLITGMISIVVIVVSFFDAFSLKISPTCISIIQSGQECSMCGMTRSFIAISNFELDAAWQLNRAAISLYTLFLINAMFTIIVVFRFINQYKKEV